MTRPAEPLAFVEFPKLDPAWLASWDWGGLDPDQARKGAEILWDQIVDDVKEFGRPMFCARDNGLMIAVTILGQLEHHIVFRLADVEILDDKERMDIAGALFALAFKTLTRGQE